jgi:hypothetical protein
VKSHPPLLHSPDSWKSFNRYHFCIYIHMCTLFVSCSSSYPLTSHLHPPTGANPPPPGWELLFFELPIYSGYQSLVCYTASEDFLPFCGWPLQFRDHFFCCVEAFKYLVAPFFNPFSLLLSCLISTEEVLAFAYCFQCIPCSFLY